ncbi:MAG: fasciclin domain-containing protein [Pyrinomonadaceae bacterium]
MADKEMSFLMREENRSQLKAMLKYHVLPGRLLAADAGALRRTVNFAGQDVRFTNTNGDRINGSALLDRDLEASNGVVHAIDAVLVPSRKED